MKAIRIFAAALVAVFAISCGPKANVKVDAELPTQGQIDSVSYLIGINFGSFIKNFADDLNDINMAEVKKGMKDFMNAEGSQYEPEFVEQFDINPNMMNQLFNEFINCFVVCFKSCSFIIGKIIAVGESFDVVDELAEFGNIT